jgi:hypothetical protein
MIRTRTRMLPMLMREDNSMGVPERAGRITARHEAEAAQP